MDSTTKKGAFFVVSGASGAGKTSLVINAISQLKDSIPIERVTTYTTRKPRPGEENGKDYVFICPAEFKQLKERDFFFETTKFNGGVYATPKKLLDRLEEGICQVAITDIEGIRSLKKLYPTSVSIWIEASSNEELKERLKNRGTEDIQTIESRIKLAKQHNQQIKNENLANHVVINESLKKAMQELIDIFKKNFKAPAQIQTTVHKKQSEKA
ncbi:hypothetical protein KAU11_02700 [Candidatus Babeliales bacterium]|nr:hypothetical protein [Candidatus Babeliales bacterium]